MLTLNVPDDGYSKKKNVVRCKLDTLYIPCHYTIHGGFYFNLRCRKGQAITAILPHCVKVQYLGHHLFHRQYITNNILIKCGPVLWCPTHIVLCFRFVCLRLVYPMFPDYQECQFLIASSVFSNVN